MAAIRQPSLASSAKYASEQPIQNGLYQASLKWLFTLICLIIPLLYWPPAYDASAIPREMLIAISAGIGLIIFSIYELRQTNHVLWHPIFIPMLILLAWGCSSYIWSMDRPSSVLSIIQFGSLILLSLFATRLTFATLVDYIFPAALIAATLAGIIGIGQHFNFNPLLLRQSAPPASTFLNVNYAANYFDLITPISFAFLLIQRRAYNPTALLAVSAFTASLGFQIVSQSRGTWLGIIVALIALIVINMQNPDFRKLFMQAIRLHHRTLIISLAIIIALAISDFHVGSHSKIEKILSMTPDVSTHIRLYAYQNALIGFMSHPWLGVGYGAFISGFSPYVDAIHPITAINQNNVLQYLHSDPLQMFFELGLVGGLLSLIIYVLVVAMAWQIIRSKAHTSLRLIGLGLMLALLASGAHACVDFPLRLPTSAFYFWIWSGITIGLYSSIYPQNIIRLPSKLLLPIGGVAGLAIIVFASQLYSAYLKTNREIRSAMIYAIEGNCKKVYSLTDHAMNNFSLDYFTRFWYAKVYTYCNAAPDAKLRAMNRILALTPNMPLAHLTRARLELASGKLESAATDFNAYRKLLPHRPEGYVGLAKITLDLHHKSQTRYWLELAAKHSPNNPEVKQLVKQLNIIK
ncbi:MAG: O-antigen ligase family protein [Gammaproteobacteria bacterium]